MTPKPHYRPKELAALWGVSTRQILDLVRDGSLEAFDAAREGSRKTRYVISGESVQEFERRRAVTRPQPVLAATRNEKRVVGRFG